MDGFYLFRPLSIDTVLVKVKITITMIERGEKFREMPKNFLFQFIAPEE